MIKTLVLWLVVMSPTQSCLEADSKAYDFKVPIANSTDTLNIRRPGAPEKPRRLETIRLLEPGDSPDFTDQNGCYEVAASSVSVSALKTAPFKGQSKVKAVQGTINGAE